MNLSPIPSPPLFGHLVHTRQKFNAFSLHTLNPFIPFFQPAFLVVGPIKIGQNYRFSYKWKSLRDKREFGYWDSDSERIEGAKFSSRTPVEDDEFDDSNPWWSEEEYDRDEYDEYEGSSQLKWTSSAVQQVLRSWIWIFPAVLIPWLVGNPMAVIMALFFPLAQTAVGSLFRQAWKAILRTVAPAPPKLKKRKKASYRKGWNQSDTMYSDSEQSTTNDEPQLHASGSTPPETSSKYSWVDPDKSRGADIQGGLNLGGWEDLDNGSARSVRATKQKTKGKLSRKLRKREVPLFFRLLVAFFPFLGFWGRYL